jgi:hypothetical protein
LWRYSVMGEYPIELQSAPSDIHHTYDISGHTGGGNCVGLS